MKKNECQPWMDVERAEDAYFTARSAIILASDGIAQLGLALTHADSAATALRVLRGWPVDVTMDLFDPVFALAISTHPQARIARELLARLDAGWVFHALRPVIEQQLASSETSDEQYQRVAGVLRELDQSVHLELVLEHAEESTDRDTLVGSGRGRAQTSPAATHALRIDHEQLVMLQLWMDLEHAENLYFAARAAMLRAGELEQLRLALSHSHGGPMAMRIMEDLPIDVTMKLFQPVFDWATTSHAWAFLSRGLLDRLDSEWLSPALGPVIKLRLDAPDADDEDYQRIAEVLEELHQTEHLTQLLHRAGQSTDPHVLDVVEAFRHQP